MAFPSVSVIIPSRNRPSFLREAVLSALNQTLPPLEILVVDNGSDPDARDAIVRLAALHECMHFIALDRNYGAGHARKRGAGGCRRGTGSFSSTTTISCTPIFWSAASRPWPRESGAQVALGRALRFHDGRSATYPRDLASGFKFLDYRKDPVSALLTQGVAVGSCLVSREAIGPCRFPAHLRFGEDTVFWLEVFRTTHHPPALAPYAFVAIRQHPGQTCADRRKLIADGAPKLSVIPNLSLILKALKGADPWLTFRVRVGALYYGGCAWHDPEVLRLLLGRPDFAARIVCVLAAKRLARAGTLAGIPRDRHCGPLPQSGCRIPGPPFSS